MADTYTPTLHTYCFRFKGRQSLIPKQHKTELHKYITGIITGKNQKVIQINSMPDHIHILIGMTPEIALSDLVRDIKANSSKLINKNRWVAGRFEWQTGFAAFSYAHSQLGAVARYIINRRNNWRTFRDYTLRF